MDQSLRKKIKPLRWLIVVCLLLITGCLLLLRADAYATGNITNRSGENTGTTDEETVINPAGEDEDISDLNIANTIRIIYGDDNGSLSADLRVLLTLTLIALSPTLLICMTCYTRIIIVLHFTRSALNTQTAPPNQVLIGLALFLTFFIMTPTVTDIYQNAFLPYEQGEIDQTEALAAAQKPMRDFMNQSTQVKDVELFMSISGREWDGDIDTIPFSVLVPSYMISELRIAFFIGFIIYIPFIVIDMVVASTLMSMGMMMLPPTTISMPFKILLFVMADGWSLVIGNLFKTFYR